MSYDVQRCGPTASERPFDSRLRGRPCGLTAYDPQFTGRPDEQRGQLNHGAGQGIAFRTRLFESHHEMLGRVGHLHQLGLYLVLVRPSTKPFPGSEAERAGA